MSDLAALVRTAHALLAPGKGLLAADESTATCNRRLSDAGITPSLAARQDWRDLLLSAPGLADSISGVILVDETLHQQRPDGMPLRQLLIAAGMRVGIKVDTGAKPLAGHGGETVTEGLDGLRERLAAYAALGASFAKWRGVIAIGDGAAGSAALPSAACVSANAHALARYAALCQQAGLVPIVEPEVLMSGAHSQARCAQVSEWVLRVLFQQLAEQGVVLEALILKPAMVLAGADCADQATPDQVAAATLACLRRVVPAAVAGIAFLSGGQSGELASARLNALQRLHLGDGLGDGLADVLADVQRPQPWPLSFSFARALQQPALAIWGGQPTQRGAAQQALLHRARCNSAALRGAYDQAREAVLDLAQVMP